MLTLRRGRPREDTSLLSAGGRPVLLATMEVPFDEAAAAFAVDAAVECGQPLIVANVVEIPLGPLCVRMGYGSLDPNDEEGANLRAPAELAHGLGVEVERLRVLSPHPLAALLELVAERRPGLLVFGPDRGRMRPRLYRKAVRRIRDASSCLVWVAE
jgi:glycine/D-amino acid oxidase-like deaminating enzyme